MATTTNFGWETPDDTDLVKDGAAAMRTLGSAIDTSLVDLKGGTTGQVLSKASGTDLDYTWVAQDDSNAIQNALLTTTGDTIYASAASTPARRAIGSTGQVLTVAGGVPTWATPSSGALTLISTTASSGVATSVTYSNCFSSTYRNYLVLMDGIQSTNTGEIGIQMRASGTTQTANYYAGRITYGTGGSVTASAQVNTSQIQVCPGSSNKFSLQAWIMNPQVGKVQFQSQFWSRNGDAGGSTLGFIDQTTSYDSMVISWGGNYTGTVSIYGYGI